MRLRVRLRARRDIDDGADWYEATREGLGDEFLVEVERSLLKIEEHPESFPVRYGEIRRANLDRFPYGVFFWLPDESTIEILAVIHGSRHPDRWPRAVTDEPSTRP